MYQQVQLSVPVNEKNVAPVKTIPINRTGSSFCNDAFTTFFIIASSSHQHQAFSCSSSPNIAKIVHLFKSQTFFQQATKQKHINYFLISASTVGSIIHQIRSSAQTFQYQSTHADFNLSHNHFHIRILQDHVCRRGVQRRSLLEKGCCRGSLSYKSNCW